MYKIGEFSKIVNISVRTLRYYDECGLLKPNLIDKYTGYRYYNEENIKECNLILLLKSLSFTIDEIIKYKDNLNDEIISKKQSEIDNKIAYLRLQYERLTIMRMNLENNNLDDKQKERVLSKNYEKRNIRKVS